MIYVGLDLHKRCITACALDALGHLLAEERRLTTDQAGLLEWLGRLTGPVTVVLEDTLYWAWLEQQLTGARYTVRVAHPYQVKLIWQARTKTDPIDARKLAELGRKPPLPGARCLQSRGAHVARRHHAFLRHEVRMKHNTAPAVLTVMSWMIITGCTAPPITISESEVRAVFTVGTTVRLFWDSTSRPVNVGGTGGPNAYDFRDLDFRLYDSITVLAVPQIPQLASRCPADAITSNEEGNTVYPVFSFSNHTFLRHGWLQPGAVVANLGVTLRFDALPRNKGEYVQHSARS